MKSEHEDGLQLSCYLDGELAGPQAARVKAHLSSCTLCREELDALRYMKRVLADAPHRTMPPELIGDIEDAVFRRSPVAALLRRFQSPSVFVPAGALATLALAASLWFGLRTAAPDQSIPLEPLLSAHARYSAETLVPQGSLVSSTYSAQLTASNDAQDPEAD